MVQGYFPAGSSTRALLQALPDGPTIERTPANEWDSETALYFDVPATFPDLTGLNISILDGKGAVVDSLLVNVPKIKWLQGDAGTRATAGGTIRLFGNALAFGSTLQAGSGKYSDYQLLESQLAPLGSLHIASVWLE